MKRRYLTIGIYTLVLIGLLDQLSKGMALDRLGDVHRTETVTPFLNFVLIWNRGVTFGFFNHNNQRYFSYALIAVAALILILLGRWLWRTQSMPVALALGAIMGGAIGNVIDRLRYGAVVDFLDFHYRDVYHWYAFNIADAAIVTGVALLLIDGMIKSK